MRALTISDNVMAPLENAENLLRNYGGVQAVISCGDMPAPYLEFITSVLNVPLLFVRGNHDTQYSGDHPGGDNLHMRVIRFKGVTLAGLEGCILYNRAPIQYTEGEMLGMVLNLWPKVLMMRVSQRRKLDVLVTHSPMKGIHDLPDYAHRGFRSLRLAVRLFRPRYMIHGHVDTQDTRKPTQTEFRGTKVININPVKLLDFGDNRP